MVYPFSEQLNFLAVGPWSDGEFAALRRQLDPDDRWPTAASLNAAIQQPDRLAAPPELVLLAQPRPGAVDQADVETWRSLWPLARIVVVAGSWCEGELRTGRPLTGVVRLYWHELAAWWREALAQLAAGNSPPWSAPLDDVRTGQWIDGDAKLPHAAEATQALAVDAVDYAVFEAIEFAVTPYGWRCLWQPRHRQEVWNTEAVEPVQAGLWDGGQLDAAEQQHLKPFCSRLAIHNAPVVALLDFPRPQHIEMAKSCGASTILGKPYNIAALNGELSRLLTPSGSLPLAGRAREGVLPIH